MQADQHGSAANGSADEAVNPIQLTASRQDALETLRSAVSVYPPRPVLITGEPGAGKTSLVGQFAAEARPDWRVVSVDLAIEMDAVEFLRLAGHPLAVPASSRLGKARIRLLDALGDEFVEGRRWLLVVNEAHRGRAGVWDEVKALANQLGRPRGFAALFLVGSTELARALPGSRGATGLAALMSTHIHLKPIDLDEARELLEAAGLGTGVGERLLEDWHRRSRGNPGVLLRLARIPGRLERKGAWPVWGLSERYRAHGLTHRAGAPGPQPVDFADEAQPGSSGEIVKEPTAATRPAATVSPRAESPPLIPAKPPIRDEDGLVEVGWEGEPEDELGATDIEPLDAAGLMADESFDTEEPPAELPAGRPAEAPTGPGTGAIRAEGQHEFAPYSELFARFRPSK